MHRIWNPEHAHPHEAVAGPKGAVALDAFAPPREEYK